MKRFDGLSSKIPLARMPVAVVRSAVDMRLSSTGGGAGVLAILYLRESLFFLSTMFAFCTM